MKIGRRLRRSGAGWGTGLLALGSLAVGSVGCGASREADPIARPPTVSVTPATQSPSPAAISASPASASAAPAGVSATRSPAPVAASASPVGASAAPATPSGRATSVAGPPNTLPTAAPTGAAKVAPLTATVAPPPVASATGAAVAPTRSGGGPAAADGLRSVDWAAVLAADPGLTKQNVSPPPPGLTSLWVEESPSQAGGHPLLNDIRYGDLDGDGREEAVILLNSGGTAGLVGFLIYGGSESHPQLILGQSGYKLDAQIEGGLLRVAQPVYAGWEGNCCPSSTATTWYRLAGRQLVVVRTRREPFDQAKVGTVLQFYGLLNQPKLTEAYHFLSPRFQAANPYAGWAAGYATTQEIANIEATEGPNGSVAIDLVAQDRTPGGGVQERRFKGRWFLVFSEERDQWLLDRAEIAPAG